MSILVEEWRAVAGHPGYEVSDHGRIRSIDRIVPHGLYGQARMRGRLQNPYRDHEGYMIARLGHGRTARVHVLVLEAFVGPRPAGMYGCHNNGNASDNLLNNLRWDSPCGNVNDRLVHGTYQFAEKNPNYSIPKQVILEIRTSSARSKDLVERLGVSEGYVSLIRAGKARICG